MTTIVLKLGGNLVAGPGLAVLAADVAALVRQGDRVVVVHGGGPQTSALQKQLGLTPRIVGGRRVTDEATLDVLKMAVGGKLNIDLCAALLAAGAKPVGLHGASSCAIEARRRPPSLISGGPPEPVDLGLVGDVVAVNHALLEALLSAGHTPVLACIGASVDGQVFNINADVVGNRVAMELRADALVLASDVPGVLRDVRDPKSRIPTITEAEGRALIIDGTVAAGMIPKLEEAFEAIAGGVHRVHIIGEVTHGDLARELSAPGSVGTALLP